MCVEKGIEDWIEFPCCSTITQARNERERERRPLDFRRAFAGRRSDALIIVRRGVQFLLHIEKLLFHITNLIKQLRRHRWLVHSFLLSYLIIFLLDDFVFHFDVLVDVIPKTTIDEGRTKGDDLTRRSQRHCVVRVVVERESFRNEHRWSRLSGLGDEF